MSAGSFNPATSSPLNNSLLNAILYFSKDSFTLSISFFLLFEISSLTSMPYLLNALANELAQKNVSEMMDAYLYNKFL